MNKKQQLHQRRKTRVRSKFTYSEKHRMTVTRSLNHISTQVISPEGKFISSASTKDKSFLAQTKGKKLTKKEKASLIGNIIAKRIQEKGLSEICFDRSGYLYHGRIKALAEGAREAGLKF